jgi:hypothetical protein
MLQTITQIRTIMHDVTLLQPILPKSDRLLDNAVHSHSFPKKTRPLYILKSLENVIQTYCSTFFNHISRNIPREHRQTF